MEFLEHSIGIARNLFNENQSLIELVKSLPTHWRAAIYNNELRPNLRKCTSFFLTELARHIPEVQEFDTKVFQAFHEGASRYQKNMNFLNLANDEGYIVMRYGPGDFIAEHSDLAHQERTVSGLLFLNDDFEGGDLVFPHQNVRIRPEPGMGVFFPSFWNYPHAVEQIKTGTRYSIATLFSGQTLTQSKQAPALSGKEH